MSAKGSLEIACGSLANPGSIQVSDLRNLHPTARSGRPHELGNRDESRVPHQDLHRSRRRYFLPVGWRYFWSDRAYRLANMRNINGAGTTGFGSATAAHTARQAPTARVPTATAGALTS